MQVILPEPNKKCRAIAMIHVHSTTAILNHNMTHVMDIKVPTCEETKTFQQVVGSDLDPMYRALLEHNPLLKHATDNHHPCRSAIFLNKDDEPRLKKALDKLRHLPFIKSLVDRALDETKILVSKGVDCIEVENIAAPYFVGGANGGVPWEEIIIEYFVATEIRKHFPHLPMGVHILSCDELEALPIAIAVGAFFIRSEATLFAGVRPEGRVQNEGNLARFMYVRRLLRQLLTPVEAHGAANSMELQFPQIWSDLHKKHTHFDPALDSMVPWLENVGFCKLEGCIITGDHTGSDVSIADLTMARKSIDGYKKFVEEKILPHSKTVHETENILAQGAPFLPLVTGSGSKFKEYAAAGADYIIVGTALKMGPYWENHIDPNAIEKVLSEIAAGEKERK